jgi:hypothetical protein
MIIHPICSRRSLVISLIASSSVGVASKHRGRRGRVQ